MHDRQPNILIERPGQPYAAIEIRSTDKASREDCRPLRTLGRDIDPGVELYLLSQAPLEQDFDGIKACHWQEGLAVP